MATVGSDRQAGYAPPRRTSLALRGFAEALNANSDHACAVLAAAFLHTALEELFLARMTPGAPLALFESSGPLEGFAARIEVAFALGWLSRPERDDLHVVREVSAAFGRDLSHAIDFADTNIRASCEALQLTNAFLEEAGLPDTIFGHDMLRELRTNARPRFEMTIGFLRQALIYRAEQAEQASMLADGES